MAEREVMSGAERAAVFLLSLGEESAATVLQHLEPSEVQNVGKAMSAMETVSSERIASVFGEFTQIVLSDDRTLVGTEDSMRRMMHTALGEDKAKTVLGRILEDQCPTGLDALRWMEPHAIAGMLKDEHPQICAIVLLALEAEHASKVLALMAKDRQPEIMMRVANLETVNPDVLQELSQRLQSELSETMNTATARVDGVRSAARILSHINAESEEDILQYIDEIDESVGVEVRDKMFAFENLFSLVDRDVQRLLREIETEDLLLSLKVAEDPLREHFYKNMSRRAAEMLREDLALREPVKLSEVEQAQREILSVVARLADEGEISFGNRSSETYV